jgi:hypothetical protein
MMEPAATVHNMALIRIISGLLEIIVAVIFLKLGKVESALRMNTFLGLVGPLVFLAVSAIGIVAVAVKLSWLKIILICLGIVLVLAGTKS